MDTQIVQTILIIAVQLIVGGILLQQIRTQKQIINRYKEVIESTDNIIALHNRELEQLKKVTEFDKEQLQNQALEMGIYIDNHLTRLYSIPIDIPDIIDRETHINRNLPHCSKFIKNIHDYFNPSTSSYL